MRNHSVNNISYGVFCSFKINGAMGRRIDPSGGGPIELFLNTFYLWLYGVGQIVEDHSRASLSD